MENKQSSSRKKLLTSQEEKLICQLNYDSLASTPGRLSKKELLLDLEILQRQAAHRPASQRVVVSIKQRVPTIKTIYIAEKNRYVSIKSSDKTGSRLALGDHSSSTTTHFSETEIHLVSSVACGTDQPISDSYETEEVLSDTNHAQSTECVSEYFKFECEPRNVNIYNLSKRSVEKCYLYTQPKQRVNISKIEANLDKKSTDPKKVDIATLIVTNTSSEELPNKSSTTIDILKKRINHLERKLLKQEMVIRSLDLNATLSSTDEECKVNNNLSKSAPATSQAGCSYISAMYSHLPEVSAFQRYAQQAAPLSPSKATSIEKEHNSEQYGRDFTAYDGITARGRRQCASVPCKRDDGPKLAAAERVFKIRHRLNPVRDYRLMDTVHYLAQGEFAPRDDGIKLTPSREAVLSDIIYEDVCRTHWPNARLARRNAQQPDRCNSRCELQRLIDSLLRERIAHVERRRRRHYRVVKLNHRHEHNRSVGKTGDIIVASHKNKQGEDNATTSALMCDRQWEESERRRTLRSRDRVMSEMQQNRHLFEHRCDESMPGPSHLADRCSRKQPTCLYQAASPAKPLQPTRTSKTRRESHQAVSSSSSTCKPKCPRLVIRRDVSRKYSARDEPDLKHYILLPTLVVRTPSNMKRQKKFNELYHRILNVQINKVNNDASNVNNEPSYSRNTNNSSSTTTTRNDKKTYNEKQSTKKDIGLNFNIMSSNSEELN